MALSPIAAKALAKAEASCYILYGSGYFTEEEWTKLDLLLHKGKHTFEDGPFQPVSNHVYDPIIEKRVADPRKQTVPSSYAEEPLLIFDDIVEEAQIVQGQAPAERLDPNVQSFERSNNTTSELEIASPMSANSEEPANTFSPVESWKSTTSSVTDDVSKENDSVKLATINAVKTTEVEQMSRLENGLATVPDSKLGKVFQDGQRPGLPPGVTLEQLELAKSFMGSVAKKFVATPSPQNSSAKNNITSQRQEPQHIDWASEVNEAIALNELPSRPLSVLSSVPSAPSALCPTSRPKARASLSPAENARCVELYTKTVGKRPNSISDYYQPNNPEFKPPWLRASTPATPPAKSTTWPAKGVTDGSTVSSASHTRSSSSLGQNNSLKNTSLQDAVPFLKISIGSIYVAAQRLVVESNSVNLSFEAGDKIRITKYVSGNMWRGENLRTKKSGHIQKGFLKEDKGPAIRVVLPIKPASIQNLVDDIEETNAAQWESDADVAESADHAQLNSKASAKSRREEPQEVSASTGITEELRVEVNKIWDEKFAQIITRNKATDSSDNLAASFETAAQMARHRRNQIKYTSPHRLVVPKTEVCWFWASNNSCRFQEHECRDLHEHRDDTAGTNFRDGRVTTWGSIRDYIDPVPEPPVGEEHTPPKDPSTTEGKQFTCHFWATGFCHHSEERCKFLHTYVGSQGVLKKPVALAANERYKNEERHSGKVLERQVKEPKAELNKPWRAEPATNNDCGDATNNGSENPANNDLENAASNDWGQAVASDWSQAVNNGSWDNTANNGWGQPASDSWGEQTQNGWFLMEGEQREEILSEYEDSNGVDEKAAEEQKDETYNFPAEVVELTTSNSRW